MDNEFKQLLSDITKLIDAYEAKSYNIVGAEIYLASDEKSHIWNGERFEEITRVTQEDTW